MDKFGEVWKRSELGAIILGENCSHGVVGGGFE